MVPKYGTSAEVPKRKWYFGHMHVDQEITEKLLGVYHKFVEI